MMEKSCDVSVPTAASMKMTAIWDIAPCSLVEVDGRSTIALTTEAVRTSQTWSTSTTLHAVISQKDVIFEKYCVSFVVRTEFLHLTLKHACNRSTNTNNKTLRTIHKSLHVSNNIYGPQFECYCFNVKLQTS
jgi:hypothetical protein